MVERSLSGSGRFPKAFLWSYNGAGIGSDASGHKITKNFTRAGLQTVYAGSAVAGFMNVKTEDGGYPDVLGVVKRGVVYAGGKLSKTAEHGGNAVNNRHVPIVVCDASSKKAGHVVTSPVPTQQVAPPILKLLSLNPSALKAVKLEKTMTLPLK